MWAFAGAVWVVWVWPCGLSRACAFLRMSIEGDLQMIPTNPPMKVAEEPSQPSPPSGETPSDDGDDNDDGSKFTSQPPFCG